MDGLLLATEELYTLAANKGLILDGENYYHDSVLFHDAAIRVRETILDTTFVSLKESRSYRRLD